MSATEPAAVDGAEGRFRYGWVFASVWLIYLTETVAGLRAHPAGSARVLGFVGLGAFVVLYLYVISQGRRRRRTGGRQRPAVQWAQLGGLTALVALIVPGAGVHVLPTLTYIAAVAMMNLPIRQAFAAVLVIVLTAETVVHVVPGWHGNGYALAVLLASVAVWGVRLAFERNQRLTEAQDELARLAVENERARIAADLHDILGHSLTVVTVKAELAQRLLDGDAADIDRARSELRDLEMLCRDALTDVRATALGVRGVSLPAEIAAAREALAAADVEARLPTAADEVPSRWRELFAWTIREAVTNLVRHSKASYCEIRLTPTSVEILDDGVGNAAPAEGGQGLRGLRRRAEALGAALVVGNRADAPGFRVLVEVPS